jgi:glucose 1-dehydrogenase
MKEGRKNMKSYYTHMNLPEPVVPAVQTIRLLKGQTALVTGANSGIGRAIAISLGKAAANVVVNYVTKPEDAEAVAEEIRSFGQRAMTAQADVADEAQVQAMFAAAVREFGTIDILVSNAGMERNAPFHEMTTMQWDAVMNVNLRALSCAPARRSVSSCAEAYVPGSRWRPARSSSSARFTTSFRGQATSTMRRRRVGSCY